MEEVRNVSQRKKFKDKPLFTKRVTELLENIEFVADKTVPISEDDLPLHARDPKDDFLLACALGGNVDYLVTGDHDLLVLNKNLSLGKLKIISAKDFLGMIRV